MFCRRVIKVATLRDDFVCVYCAELINEMMCLVCVSTQDCIVMLVVKLDGVPGLRQGNERWPPPTNKL